MSKKKPDARKGTPENRWYKMLTRCPKLPIVTKINSPNFERPIKIQIQATATNRPKAVQINWLRGDKWPSTLDKNEGTI